MIKKAKINKEYFPFITGLKGYAALAIFGRHLLPYKTWGVLGDSVIGSLAHFVTVFFFLSGFTLTSSILHSKRFNYNHYLTDRFFRIAPLYWLVCIFAFLFSNITFGAYYQDQVGIGRFDVMNLLHHLLFTNGIFARYQNTLIGVEWTIPIEVFYYFLIPSIVFVAVRSFGGLLAFVFLGIILKYFYMQVRLPLYIGSVFHDLWYIERYLISFCLGVFWYMLFFHGRTITSAMKNITALLLPLMFGVVSLFIVYRESYAVERIILLTLVGISGYSVLIKPRLTRRVKPSILKYVIQSLDVVLLIPLFVYYLISPKASFEILISIFTGVLILACRDQYILSKIVFQNRFVLFAGTISYSIYLLHVPIIKLVGMMTDGILTVLTSIILVLCISLLSHRYIESAGKNLGNIIKRRYL